MMQNYLKVLKPESLGKINDLPYLLPEQTQPQQSPMNQIITCVIIKRNPYLQISSENHLQISKEIISINKQFSSIKSKLNPTDLYNQKFVSFILTRLQAVQKMNVIEKGIKINKKYHDAEQYAKKIQGISRSTNWFETKTKYEGAKRIQQENKKTEKEMEFGRRQLLIRRSTRLQQLYEQELNGWENSLREKGISIYKNKN